ncbi:hypothetical protein DDE18_11875 [Nocardioides gansuensis]|uniref:Uncharacterized protein n=1 Tax=Nocardioides gansuensis TaxID=2138300 RepID=A0A2T8F925_9ACTN|nr:hypothetical protein [Nocardioides gansuensis]PVG82195.1 hypothetical protein DDE18_11875 [Nocardioides gansuensis]
MTLFLLRKIGRGWGVIMMTLGIFGVGSSVFASETSKPTSLVLSVILLFCGAGLFFVSNRGSESEG